MKRLSISLLVLIVGLASCTVIQQKEMVKEGGTSSFQPKPLDDDWSNRLVGEWEISAELDTGQFKNWAKGTGRLEGNREIMEWQWSGTGQGATSVGIIEKISDNRFKLNHKYNLPDGSKMEDRVVMTRKVDDAKGKEAHKMSIRFSMIGIFVNDLQKTVEFYRDVIGLEVKETAESYAEFKHDGFRFAAFERMMLPKWIGVTPAYPDGLNGTFELAIDLPHFEDVDREFDRVVKAGAKPVMEPKDMPWGQRSSVVTDPDGNFIEIGSFNSGEQDG